MRLPYVVDCEQWFILYSYYVVFLYCILTNLKYCILTMLLTVSNGSYESNKYSVIIYEKLCSKDCGLGIIVLINKHSNQPQYLFVYFIYIFFSFYR